MNVPIRNKNKRGDSLTVVIVAMFISSLGFILFMNLFTTTGLANKKIEIDSLLTNFNSLSMAQIRNFEVLRGALEFDNRRLDCLKRRGTDCTSFNSSTFTPILLNEWTATYDENLGLCNPLNNNRCFVSRNAGYRLVCASSNVCAEVEINVQTKYNGKPLGVISRSETFRMPASTFVSVEKAPLDTSCTGNNTPDSPFIISIDSVNNIANCRAQNAVCCKDAAGNCTDAPIRSFDSSNGICQVQ